MQIFALVAGDVVRELIELEQGAAVADRFHPDFVTQMRPAAAEVRPGWRWNGQGFGPPAPPTVSNAEARALRDALLSACDWTQLADAPLAAPERAAWTTYRAALRALTEQPGFPAAVTWPVAPGV